ncbi:hypothetical protein ABW21_db0203191 [Orbilia brochopaga]|nr:hypothetical protein ABW21_db0203191 [Drechslerella brochopaga]
MPAHQTTHHPQHRTNSHVPKWDQYYCAICNPPVPTLPYELDHFPGSGLYYVQVLDTKYATSHGAASKAFYASVPVITTRSNLGAADRRLRVRGTKTRILTDRQRHAVADANFETERRIYVQQSSKVRQSNNMWPRSTVDRYGADAVVVTANKKNKGSKGRNLKGRRTWLDDEMDVHDADLLNWDHEMNFERRDVYEEREELKYGEADEEQLARLRTLFPDAHVDRTRNVDMGDALSDEDLRALGLLYDSPEEDAEMEGTHSTHSHSHPHICEHIEAVMENMPDTPRATPYTPDGSATDARDMDELWVIVGEQVVRVPEVPSEWDVVSEYLLT